jgi:two-component system sensor histidine kinase/response regulator
MLGSLSCRVTAVDSGQAALSEAARAAAAGSPYRLAVLDWKMPGLDGAEAAARLASSRDLPKLPVILVTAYEREYAAKRAGETGIDAVLHKPVSPSALHDAVLGVLRPTERAERKERVAVRFDAGKRVLLVEDNEINRQVARELLALAGLEVVEAHNGYAALDQLVAGRFDAVLMDVQMPELDGVETVKAIRAQERFRSLPVIAMTAHAMLGDRERFLESGMSDYIAKPIEEEELLGVLSRWINIGAVPSTPEAAVAPQMPEILPGLNVGDGIRRASGNVQLYRRLIVELRRDLETTMPRVRDMLDRGSNRDALDLLHTLKGSAATMGARHLADTAASLESRLRANEKVELVALEAAIAEVRSSIVILSRADGEGSPAEREGGPSPSSRLRMTASAALLPIARKMREHLEHNNLAAMGCFEELRTLAGTRFAEPMQHLEESLDRLDFETARAHLGVIESHLGAEE